MKQEIHDSYQSLQQTKSDLEHTNQSLELMVEERTVELDAAKHRFELIIHSAGEGIYGVDMEGNTTFANPAALEMTGYTQEEMEGNPQHDLIHHSYPDGSAYPKEQCKIYKTFRQGKITKEDHEVFWRKDGSSFVAATESTNQWHQ